MRATLSCNSSDAMTKEQTIKELTIIPGIGKSLATDLWNKAKTPKFSLPCPTTMPEWCKTVVCCMLSDVRFILHRHRQSIGKRKNLTGGFGKTEKTDVIFSQIWCHILLEMTSYFCIFVHESLKGKTGFNPNIHITKPIVRLSPSKKYFTLSGVSYERVEAPAKKTAKPKP